MKAFLLIVFLGLPAGQVFAMLPDDAHSESSATPEREAVDVECEPDDPACVA